MLLDLPLEKLRTLSIVGNTIESFSLKNNLMLPINYSACSRLPTIDLINFQLLISPKISTTSNSIACNRKNSKNNLQKTI